MPERNFEAAGALAMPGTVGRLVRLAAGIALLTLVAWNAATVGSEVDSNPGLWIGAGISLWLIIEVVNVGLGKDWGQLPRIASIVGAVVLFIVGLIVTGAVLSQLFLWGLMLYTLGVYGWLGTSFILAAGFAVPG